MENERDWLKGCMDWLIVAMLWVIGIIVLIVCFG